MSGATAPPHTTASVVPCGRLLPDEALGHDQVVTSCDGDATLALHHDGNIVLYDAAGPAWLPPNSFGQGSTALRMQADGNLVASNAAGELVWASGTYGHNGGWLAIQDDCNLVIYPAPYDPQATTRGPALWSSNTLCRAALPTGGKMLPGDRLSYGLSFTSPSGNARLSINADQQVVLYAPSAAWWAPNTQNRGTTELIMQHDGNLVARDRLGQALWHSGTHGNDGAWLQLQDDCNLVIYRKLPDNTVVPLWATMTSCWTAPLSPVTGPFERRCTWATPPIWDFCQHRGGYHGPGLGYGGADDTYAWDANLANGADAGRPVYAVAPGHVVRYGGPAGTLPGGGAAHAVLVQHNTNGTLWWSGYLHMTGVALSVNQAVTTNTVLGYVGNAGTGSPHLHFAIYTGSNTPGGLRSYDSPLIARQ